MVVKSLLFIFDCPAGEMITLFGVFERFLSLGAIVLGDEEDCYSSGS